MIKIDASYSVGKVNKYLRRIREKRYDFDQNLILDRTYYDIQVGKLGREAKRFISNPLRENPRLAYSILSAGLFLTTRQEEYLYGLMIGAITEDNKWSNEDGEDPFSITVGSNDDRMLIFGYGHYQGDSTPPTVSYPDGVSNFTQLHDQEGSYEERATIYSLVAPSTGTNDVGVSGEGNWSGFGTLSAYNCDQNDPTNYGGSSGSSSTASHALTTNNDNSWVVAIFGVEPTPTMTTSGGVEIMKEQGQSYQNAEMHYVSKATAGSQTMSCSLSYGARWNVAALELEEVAAATTYIERTKVFAGK